MGDLKDKILQVYNKIEGQLDLKQDLLTPEQMSAINQLTGKVVATQDWVTQQIQDAISDALSAQY